MRNTPLYSRLQSFRFEPADSALTFSRRLAREHDWTRDFGERVVAEYLRFVYLTAVADTPLTPSVAVDQAWHLHLCYTRSYWENLCRDVLPRPLHHGPTQGGREEGNKFREWYERTLALYTEEFGEQPPPDIWPAANERFAPDAQPMAVSTRDYWVIEKRLVRRMGVSVAGAAMALSVWIGAKSAETRAFAIAFVVVCAIVIVGIVLSSGRRRKGRNRTQRGGEGGGCGTGCGTDSGCGGGGGCGGGD